MRTFDQQFADAILRLALTDGTHLHICCEDNESVQVQIVIEETATESRLGVTIHFSHEAVKIAAETFKLSVIQAVAHLARDRYLAPAPGSLDDDDSEITG